MDDLINLIIFIIFGIVALIGRLLSRKGQQREPEVALEEREVILPPWGNLPMEQEAPSSQPIEPQMPPVLSSSPSIMPAPQEISARAEIKPALTPEIRTVPPPPSKKATIAGIPLSLQTFRQGIILSEILGRPKSLRYLRK